MSFGENLREYRGKCELSRKELAERIHVSPGTVAKWENGLQYPTKEHLLDLINEFGVSSERLLEYDEVILERLLKQHSDLKNIARILDDPNRRGLFLMSHPEFKGAGRENLYRSLYNDLDWEAASQKTGESVADLKEEWKEEC